MIDEAKIENLPVRSDGFEDNDSDTDRLLQGTRLVCVDGEWKTPDGTAIPPGKRYFVVGTAEGLQHWQGGELLKETIKKANEERLPDIEPLNNEIPQADWDVGINGPRPPWSHVFAVYLLDPEDGSIHTHLNSTAGAAIHARIKEPRQVEARDARWPQGIANCHAWPALGVAAIQEMGTELQCHRLARFWSPAGDAVGTAPNRKPC
jgi:hypothetical protein